jgi:hypothetical protein
MEYPYLIIIGWDEHCTYGNFMVIKGLYYYFNCMVKDTPGGNIRLF